MAGSQFTEEEIRRSLLTLAKHAGNSVAASRELNEQGLVIAGRTLRKWRTEQYPDLYSELHELHAREIEAMLAPQFREVAQAAAEASREAVDVALKDLRSGNTRDPAGAARNLMVTAATATDKLYLTTDRPTEARQGGDVLSLLRSLEAIIPGLAPTPPVAEIDSSAEEIS